VKRTFPSWSPGVVGRAARVSSRDEGSWSALLDMSTHSAPRSSRSRTVTHHCEGPPPSREWIVSGDCLTDVMSDEITTARLRLRRWRPEDEQPMAAINRDPAVTEFLNRPVDEQAVAAFLGRVNEHWEQHGFGFYALELRDGVQSGTFVGFVGVAYPSFLPEVASRPELGWRLGRAAWGQGVATEAACAVRDDALGRLGLAELISVIHPRNARSQRVATKLGMTIERQVHHPVLALDVDIWQLDRADMAVGSKVIHT
jgi:RimJ/RimL family protein N-acetyltransferase